MALISGRRLAWHKTHRSPVLLRYRSHLIPREIGTCRAVGHAAPRALYSNLTGLEFHLEVTA
jgi:hypothetical protein